MIYVIVYNMLLWNGMSVILGAVCAHVVAITHACAIARKAQGTPLVGRIAIIVLQIDI